jgi:NAD+ synthase (glutamine-hydrolysing)
VSLATNPSQKNLTSEDAKLKFKNQEGNWMEDLTLQNLQARLRLVSSYLCAQTLQAKGLSKKFFLVVGTGNCSEMNRGYFTKYDNSSGDINFIGDLSKGEIFNLIRYYSREGAFYFRKEKGKEYDADQFSFLEDLVKSKPTAELRPISKNDRGNSQKRVTVRTD